MRPEPLDEVGKQPPGRDLFGWLLGGRLGGGVLPVREPLPQVLG
jgi:hypothetical protein